MKFARLHGVIERRLLVNFRADPKVIAKLLPGKFRPQLVGGEAMVGICLIRLNHLRPGFLPPALGLKSENAAHRIAVEWDTPNGPQTGVYVHRRDTSNWLNSLVGGRVFPGVQNRANFDVREDGDDVAVALESLDGSTKVAVSGQVAKALPKSSIFKDVKESSDFFKMGATGYSPGLSQGKFQGMKLVTDKWKVQAFDIRRVDSSFFSDQEKFPEGSVTFDHALIMRDLEHSWEIVPRL